MEQTQYELDDIDFAEKVGESSQWSQADFLVLLGTTDIYKHT